MAIFSYRQYTKVLSAVALQGVSIALPDRHRDISQLPTTNIASQSSQSPGEVTRKVSGYSTAPKLLL